MKILLDENVPNYIKKYLLDKGYTDIKRINDFGKGLPDEDVFRIATQEKRVLITIDTDFYEYKKVKNYGVICISGKIANKAIALLNVLEQIKKDERFSSNEWEDIFICITCQNFRIIYKKKNKYKEIICKYKR